MAPSNDLLRLAEDGLAAYPPSGLVDLTASCRDLCRALPDPRYCTVADALQILVDWFEERDRYGNVPPSSMDELSETLRRLRLIVEEPEPAVAVAMAFDLQTEVGLIVQRGEDQLNAMYREPQ